MNFELPKLQRMPDEPSGSADNETIKIGKQYNEFAENFADKHKNLDEITQASFQKALLGIVFKDKKVIDLGCGDGYDLLKLQEKGAIVYGLDASEEMIKLAKAKNSQGNFENGFFENIPYADASFDVVISKYAMQTSKDVPKILEEVGRILKPGGKLVYVVTHPVRQFMEKKKANKDYFEQEVVDSVLFDGAITVHEPSHTLAEYLNPEFLKNFDLTFYEEKFDPSNAEMVEGSSYPAFLCVGAKRKNASESTISQTA
ncbi:MAG: class I SAM-dependent methyltransferase [bacterium]